MNPRDTLLAKLAMNVSLSSRREERAGPSPRRSGFVLAGRPPRADPLRPSDNGFGHAGGERRAIFIGFPLSLTLSPLLRRGERELTSSCRVSHSLLSKPQGALMASLLPFPSRLLRSWIEGQGQIEPVHQIDF